MPNPHISDRQVMRYMTSRSPRAFRLRKAAAKLANPPGSAGERLAAGSGDAQDPRHHGGHDFEELQDDLGAEFSQTASAGRLNAASPNGAPFTARTRRFSSATPRSGRQALSDFTVADSLNVTIAGEPCRIACITSAGLQRLEHVQ